MTSLKLNNSSQNMRHDDRKEEKPPYSRIFVVCDRHFQEDDLLVPFKQFGDVENIYIPKDRHTGESKGVAYIKYSKTSAAAAAIQQLHMTKIKNRDRPIKVMVATNKNDVHATNEERYKRLFIKVPRDTTESEIRQHFVTFGHVESVHLQRDKETDACKGFAYVNYSTFLEAAKAFEECDRKYKPVFATPKDELKRSRNSLEGIGMNFGSRDNFKSMELCNYPRDEIQRKDNNISALIKNAPMNFETVEVTCVPQIPQKHIEKLFNIVPGMLQFHYTTDPVFGHSKAIVTYESEKAAAYAVERLNNFEFPSGQILSVKPHENPINKAAENLTAIVNSFKNSISSNPNILQLADAISQASNLIRAATSGKVDTKMENQDNVCSVSLPPPQPMANINSRVAQRCFIVCKPQPPPIAVLRDTFARFGDLIDVCTFPNKTFGFAKYASITAAQEAMRVLNGAMLCGVRLKVLEADEKRSKDEDKMNIDEQNENNTDHDKVRKRMKLDEMTAGSN